MSPSAVFERNFNLHQLPATLRLRNLDWSVYFNIDGERSAGEIQAVFRLDGPQRDDVFSRLVQMDLIREKKLNLEEHVQAAARNADPSDPKSKSLEEFVRTTSGGKPPSRPVLAVTGLPAPSPAPAPSSTFTPLPPPSASKTMSLLSVIRFIQEQNRDKTAGQLAVYRVFMGVDTKLLKKNGIQSLRFQEDRLITDTELQQSISENVSKALRKNLPQSVYM